MCHIVHLFLLCGAYLKCLVFSAYWSVTDGRSDRQICLSDRPSDRRTVRQMHLSDRPHAMFYSTFHLQTDGAACR